MKEKNICKDKEVLIIGGGAVGMAVATSLKRHSGYSVKVFSADSHTAYSQCGMPFAIGGEIKDLDSLIIRDKQYFIDMGIDIRLSSKVDSISINDRSIISNGEEHHFDRLVIATGSIPKIPANLKGTSLKNVFTLRTLSDGKNIEEALQSSNKIVIIGAGSIGAEMAIASVRRGIDTTIVSRSTSILSQNMDPDMAQVVQDHLESRGVRVITGYTPESINGKGKVVSVTIDSNDFPADIVLIATGVEPENELASGAGIDIGDTGGIIVDRYLHPRIDGDFDKDIYCGGECAEVYGLITKKAMLSPIASTARRMAGTIAGNLTSKNLEFGPVLDPWVAVIGDVQAGTTGITTKHAIENGIKIVTGIATGSTSAGYYPGGSKLYIKLLFSNRNLVGAQVVGGIGVKERIDALTLAIKKKTTAQELASSETCYAPPVSTLIDPVNIAAKGAIKKIRNKKI